MSTKPICKKGFAIMQKNPKGGGKHQGKVEKPKEKALYGKMHRKIYCNFRPIGNVEGKMNN